MDFNHYLSYFHSSLATEPVPNNKKIKYPIIQLASHLEILILPSENRVAYDDDEDPSDGVLS